MNLQDRFAYHLRNLRKQRGITQKELAEQIGCSEKAVSKWETGISIPDIEMLFSLAKALRTDLESMFSDFSSRYYLGIDGGGTKTKLRLTNEDGSFDRSLVADGCNPMDIGLSACKEILREAIFEILGEIPCSSVTMYAGLAGGTSGNMQSELASFFETFRFHMFWNDTDNKNIIAAGLDSEDGITVILGTGVCSFLQKNGEHSMVGGRGYLIDNGGSGYHLGRDALNAYFCEKDGTGCATRLSDKVETLSGVSLKELVQKVYEGGKKYIASYAGIVYEAVREGDPVADEILRRNMKEAALLIETNGEKLNGTKIPVVLAGGLTNDPLTIQYLRDALADPARYDLKVLDKDPVDGALMLAKKLEKKEG